MWHERVMAFDTETTGFRKTDEIVELSLVFFEDGREVEVWDTMIRPKHADPNDPQVREALDINHLTMEKLATAYRFEEMVEEISEQLLRCPVWVAHNSSFDERMLRQEFERLGFEMPKPDAILCTMTIDRVLNKFARGGKLGDVCNRWGVVLEDAHEATADARACGEVLVKMVKSGMLPDELEKILPKQFAQQQQSEAYFKRRKQGAAA